MPRVVYPERVINIRTSVSDVTASRAKDVEYQNTSNRPKLVLIGFGYQNGAGQKTSILIMLDDATPCVTDQGQWEDTVQNSINHAQLVILVPPGWYYEMDTTTGGTTGTVTLQRWIEVEL